MPRPDTASVVGAHMAALFVEKNLSLRGWHYQRKTGPTIKPIYRGASLIRKRTPLGHFSRTMPSGGLGAHFRRTRGPWWS